MSDTLRLDQQLCFALYASTNLLTRVYRRHLDPLDLTYSQYLVLLALWERDDLLVSELSDQLHLTSATLTPILQKMETKGLVQRNRSRDDQRHVHLRLTTEGRGLRRRVKKMLDRVIGELSMAPDDVRHLRDQLHAFVNLLEPIIESHPSSRVAA